MQNQFLRVGGPVLVLQVTLLNQPAVGKLNGQPQRHDLFCDFFRRLYCLFLQSLLEDAAKRKKGWVFITRTWGMFENPFPWVLSDHRLSSVVKERAGKNASGGRRASKLTGCKCFYKSCARLQGICKVVIDGMECFK